MSKAKPSIYGAEVDDVIDRWFVLENEHDGLHPDRSQCGGVGGCSLMMVAARLEQELVQALEAWRGREALDGAVAILTRRGRRSVHHDRPFTCRSFGGGGTSGSAGR